MDCKSVHTHMYIYMNIYALKINKISSDLNSFVAFSTHLSHFCIPLYISPPFPCLIKDIMLLWLWPFKGCKNMILEVSAWFLRM